MMSKTNPRNAGRKKLKPTKADKILLALLEHQKTSEASIEREMGLPSNTIYAWRKNKRIAEKHKIPLIKFLRNHIAQSSRMVEDIEKLGSE